MIYNLFDLDALLAEKETRSQELENLVNFFNSGGVQGIDEVLRNTLITQIEIMRAYVSILQTRVDLLLQVPTANLADGDGIGGLGGGGIKNPK